MGGSGGLLFAEDLEDVIDGLAQLLGDNFSAKKARQEALEAMLLKGIADFLDKGVNDLPGALLDVSGRLRMGNPVPPAQPRQARFRLCVPPLRALRKGDDRVFNADQHRCWAAQVSKRVHWNEPPLLHEQAKCCAPFRSV
ncbi:hypothetical protein M2282_005224 [Variovorax boronicumulans]|uniref:hypothetical protein n=1 Tax=Variovorax boronicumulans TaxID=436515 RepID=UPI0024767B41|nr:hypothetical protein [Variovorax boronicumulans]MDH6170054.1 hypothetical protein [Variovorax boronicumulans]